MEKKDLRIVYMGTPDFAVESLRRLVEGGYNVVGICRGTPVFTSRFTNCRCFPYASRNSMEHAASGYIQPACLFIAPI